MNKSETIGELAKALAKAQSEMTFAKKDNSNPFFKSKYADLANVVEAIKKPLADNGLAYVQATDIDDGGVIIETTLMHSSGEWYSSRLRMKPVKDDPQGIGSCITYARRYGLQALVGVPSDDDDGNAASGKDAKPIGKTQLDTLAALMKETGTEQPKFCQFFKVKTLAQLHESDYGRAVAMLEKKKEAA